MLYENIKKLVEYGIKTGLTPECERVYTTNLLLDLFGENNYEDVETDMENLDLEEILAGLLEEAKERGLVEDSVVFRDLFDTKLMNCLLQSPGCSLPLPFRTVIPANAQTCLNCYTMPPLCRRLPKPYLL